MGGEPQGNLTLDQAGNLYGTAFGGRYGNGVVFQLAPSGSGWVLDVLYSFEGGIDGANPYGPLIFDRRGDLYGATSGGPGSSGTVFMLSGSGSV
ncbi:MAG: choice-of-anchor tandem repeat GloVer-containing protein [Candidatus Korobacteraceae bacterium]